MPLKVFFFMIYDFLKFQIDGVGELLRIMMPLLICINLSDGRESSCSNRRSANSTNWIRLAFGKFLKTVVQPLGWTKNIHTHRLFLSYDALTCFWSEVWMENTRLNRDVRLLEWASWAKSFTAPLTLFENIIAKFTFTLVEHNVSLQ